MDEADWLAARSEEQRAHLRAVAYRMLGSQAEADDAVQNSWLRLSGADTSEVENLAGWLTTVVARECLKMLRSRRGRREEPLADAVTEPPGSEHDVDDPEAAVLLADAVGPALMVVLDTLAPAERLAFVLHDIFAVPFDDIAPILERSAAATRQSAGLPGGAASMRGAHAVGAYALKFSRGARFVRPALVDGTPGLAIRLPGRLIGAMGFTVDGDTIAAIDMISDRGRLRHVDLAAPGE
jgi:RNA polymerase sigma-70 factor (ECF subfamily)